MLSERFPNESDSVIGGRGHYDDFVKPTCLRLRALRQFHAPLQRGETPADQRAGHLAGEQEISNSLYDAHQFHLFATCDTVLLQLDLTVAIAVSSQT